jgi:PKD repeat protein
MQALSLHLPTLAFLFAATAAHAATEPAVVKGNGTPVAHIKDNVICCPGERVVVDGWASIDVGGEVTHWLWDYDGDGTTDTTTTAGELVVAAPRSSKVYAIALRVRDNAGNVSEPDTAMVHVMDVGPKVRLRADTTVKVGVRVMFQPQVTWVCARPAKFEWDLDGDGVFEYNSDRDGNTSKAFYTPGRFQAQFFVVDAAGHKAGGVTTVVVTGRHGDQVSSTADSSATAPEL